MSKQQLKGESSDDDYFKARFEQSEAHIEQAAALLEQFDAQFEIQREPAETRVEGLKTR